MHRREIPKTAMPTSVADLDNQSVAYRDHGPIALYSWGKGEHGYSNILPTVDERVKSIRSDRKRNLARAALLSRMTDHAARSFDNLYRSGIDQQELSESDIRVINGEAATHQFVEFMGKYPQLSSIEIARLVHPGDWNVRRFIDDPVPRAR